MIELPEATNISRDLKKEILNKKIVDVIVKKSPHKFAFFSGDTNFYKGLLVGSNVTDVLEHSFYVEIKASNSTLIFRDGVNIRYHKDDKNIPKKHQFLIKFDDNSYIICTISMYGFIYCFKDKFDDKYYNLALNGISPISKEFDYKYFLSLIDDKTKKLSAKAFIATEQRILGIGNGVVQDILFNAKINPKAKINSLSEEKIKVLFDSIRNTLNDMINQGGRNTERNIYGEFGKYNTIMCNNNKDKPCPICGTKIVKENYLGGSIYYCSNCQRRNTNE